MIKFKLINGKYMIGDDELLTSELLQYPHEINGDVGFIDLGYNIGDTVTNYFRPIKHYPIELHNTRQVTVADFKIYEKMLVVKFVEHEGNFSPLCVSKSII